MLEVSKYIQELLFEHNCVILPGFGGFVANYKSARIDENQQLVFPPSKDIGFNRNLNQNDGLLINHLAKAENLKYVEAEKSIRFFIEDLKVRIQRGENVELNNIGSFYADRKQNLQFEPADQQNYLADSFGLEQFDLPSILPKTDLQKPVVTLTNNGTKRIASNKRFWYVGAAAVGLLVVSLLPMSSDDSSFLSKASIGLLDSNKKVNSVDHVQLRPQISPPEELVRYEPQINEPQGQLRIQETKKNKYYLIAGSFTTANNANILKEELIKKSYPAIIIRNKNLYSVAINEFDTRTAIDQFKKRVIADNPKASCWVLKK